MDDSEREIQILRQVFRRFDSNGSEYLNEEEFGKLVSAVVRRVPEIESVDLDVSKAVFAYLDTDNDGRLSFQDIYKWWILPDRFKFFREDKARLFLKARQLFTTYSGGEHNMSFQQFENLLDDLKISHKESTFDDLDGDGNGLMSFPEFIDWLGWFKS